MNRSKYKMTISLTAKKMRNLFLLLLSIVALIAPMQHVSAQQQFPVKIQPSVSFPSTFLSDYADPANTNIRVFLSDVTKQDYLINVRVTLTNLSTKGISYSSVHGINVTVDGGVPYFLNSNELLNLFAFNDMQILGGTQEPNILPEGQYSMSLQAYDGNLLPAIEVPVSNALTDFTLFMVVRYDPPLLNSPVDKQEFDLQTTNQNIFFNWTPRHIAYTSLHIQYRYRLVRVLPVDRNPYDAVNASVTGATGNIDADALDFATFIYSPSDLQLIPGAVYAWQVQAYEMVNGKVSTARFKNQGLSEVFTLSIKENCGQITLVPPVITGNSVTFTWNGDAHSTYNEYEFNYRKVGSNLPWTPITTAQNTITLDNTVLQTGIAYEYNVRARCNNWLAPVQGSNVTLSKPTCSTPAPLTVNTSNNSTLLSWTAVDGPDSLQLSYKITGSTDPFTTKILYPSDVQYALPLLTSGGYTIRLDAFCGAETVLGAENTIDYNENGVVGPCPVPMPFELVATRLKGSGSAVNTQSDAANIKWNLMTVHTGSKITYWHKDSSAVTYTYTQLDPALGVNGIHVYDDQMYMYQVDYLCSATKHIVTPVGMFRILSSSGQLNLDPPTANCFPPVDIRAEARDTVSARVEWDKVSGAEGYELSYRIKGAKTPFATFNTTAANAILKPLEANAQYQLLVRVKCGGVFSIYSDTALVDLSLGRTRNCDTVSFFTSLLKTTTNIQVAWQYDSTCTGYIIKFREDAQPISSEYTQAFTNIDSLKHNNVVRDTARYTFQNLKSGTKYIFRIQKICGQNNALFNIPIEVSTLADAKSDGTCGSGKVCDKNPAAPLKSLAVGDSIYCADYGIVVDSLTTATSNPSAGLYSGLGHMNMPVPGLGDFVSMHVSFKNVKINDKPNSCVYDGTINIDSMNASIIPITIRDSVKALMAKAQGAVDQANALLAQAQAGIDQLQAGLQQGIDYFQGGDGVGSVKTGQLGDQQIATNISVPPPTATVSGTQVTVNGVTATVSSLPALLKDTDGEVFQVTSTGQLTYVGKYDTTFAKDTTLDLSDQVVTYTEYTGTPGPIYDFDAYQDIFSNSIQLKSEYEKINDNYYVPAKFITPGMLDKVTATINTSNADARKVVFSNSTGFVYDASPNGKTFTLNLAGGPASDGQYIYAWYVDGPTKKAIGKLLMPSYAPQTKNVVIIPVKDPVGRVYDASIFESYLNQTYNKIGITYHVTIDNSFNTNTDWTTDGITSIQPTSSGLLNDDYRGKEKDVINAYVAFKGEANIDAQTAYFIMVNEVSTMKDDKNVQLLGKMPPEEQFGFIYSGGFGGNGSANAVNATVTAAIANGLKRTVAHELGHGAYHLEHTFIALYLGKDREQTTDNLMDYNGGNVLWKLQWDVIHDPGHVWGILRRDKDAQALAGKTPKDKFCEQVTSLQNGEITMSELNDYIEKKSLTDIPYLLNDEFCFNPVTVNDITSLLYKIYCATNVRIDVLVLGNCGSPSTYQGISPEIHNSNKSNKGDITFYVGNSSFNYFTKADADNKTHFDEYLAALYEKVNATVGMDNSLKLECIIKQFIVEAAKYYNISSNFNTVTNSDCFSSPTADTEVIDNPIEQENPATPTVVEEFKITEVITTISLSQTVTIKWKLSSNSNIETNTLRITKLNGSEINQNVTNVDNNGYYSYSYIEDAMIAVREILYEIEASKLGSDGTELNAELNATTGGFHGWSYVECPQYNFVKLGNAMPGPYASYKWTDVSGNVVIDLVGKETLPVIEGFTFRQSYNLKVVRKHIDTRITDVGYISTTKKSCPVHLVLEDLSLPISSNNRRYVTEGGTLGIVVDNDTRNDAFNITNMNQPGAQAVVNETSQNNSGVMNWYKNSNPLPSNANNPILNINTLSGLNVSALPGLIASDNIFLVKTYGGNLQATLQTFKENVVSKSTISGNPNADAMNNLEFICNMIGGISDAFDAVGIDNFGIDCDGPNYTIYEYNAEKVGSPMVVRDESGSVSINMTANMPAGAPIPLGVLFEMQIELIGGGGVLFEYDLNKRNSIAAVYPPTKFLSGSTIVMGLKFNISTIGSSSLKIGAGAELSVPVEIRFISTAQCSLGIEVSLQPIVLEPVLKAGDGTLSFYKYKVTDGGKIYQGCPGQ